MPNISENNPKKLDEPLCIFDSIEEAFGLLLIVSYGLENECLTDFDLPARKGVSKTLRQACTAGFNLTDKDNSKETEKSNRIVELIEGGKSKEN